LNYRVIDEPIGNETQTDNYGRFKDSFSKFG